MTEAAQKTWALTGPDLQQNTVTGTRVEMHPTNGRVTFYNGDEVVASFLSLHGFALLDTPSE